MLTQLPWKFNQSNCFTIMLNLKGVRRITGEEWQNSHSRAGDHGKEGKRDVSFLWQTRMKMAQASSALFFIGRETRRWLQKVLGQAAEETDFEPTSLMPLCPMTSPKVYSVATYITRFETISLKLNMYKQCQFLWNRSQEYGANMYSVGDIITLKLS